MSLFKPAVNHTAYLKLGMLGFEGSGKTFTAMMLAIGLTKHMIKLGLIKKTEAKIGFFDTEKASDFFVEVCRKEGIQLFQVKSRSFKDLLDAIKEAEREKFTFLIIDSISHVWRELVSAWLKNARRNFLTIKDWGVLKEEWAQFTTLYTNSKLHINMLGRAGHEYDTSEDADGNEEMKKSGTKMKVEGETGFEPDVLLEMFKSPRVKKTTLKNGKTKAVRERGFVNKCVVLKDRNNVMNGKEIEMPKFEDFMPIIEKINLGGEHKGVDSTRTSEGMFESPDNSHFERQRRRDIAIEQMQELLVLAGCDGTSADAKKRRTEALIAVYGTSAKTAIENMHPRELEDNLPRLRKHLGLQTPDDVEAERLQGVVNQAAAEDQVSF